MAVSFNQNPLSGPSLEGQTNVESGQLLTNSDNKVSQTALSHLPEGSGKIYTSPAGISFRVLQCVELRDLVASVSQLTEDAKTAKTEELKTWLNDLAKNKIQLIRAKQPQVEKIVKLHQKILSQFIIYQYVVSQEITNHRLRIEEDLAEISDLLRKRNAGEAEAANDLSSYQNVLDDKDIQILLKTLHILVKFQTQLQGKKQQQSEAVGYQDDQKKLIEKINEDLCQSIQTEVKKIEITSLPKVKTEKMGSVQASLICAFTQSIVVLHKQVIQELDTVKSDLDHKKSEAINLLENEFSSDQPLTKKLEDCRVLSVSVAAFKEIIKAENQVEIKLNPELRRALILKRQAELKEFKSNLCSMDSLSQDVVKRINGTILGQQDLTDFYQEMKKTCEVFNEQFNEESKENKE